MDNHIEIYALIGDYMRRFQKLITKPYICPHSPILLLISVF